MTALFGEQTMPVKEATRREASTAIAPTNQTPIDRAMAIIESGQNLPVETLERVIALQERLNANAAREAFNQAMAAAQAEMPVVVNDRENTQTHSRYPSLEAVQNTIKSVYLRHGFTCTFAEDGAPVEGIMHIIGVVRHVAGHTETFSRYAPADTAGPQGKANKTPVQGAQSTLSYLTRRLLCSIWGVTVANEDKDGNAGSGAFISDEQKAELSDLIREKGADVAAFLKWAEVDSLSEMSVGQYRAALPMLRKKASIAGGKDTK